MSKEILEYQSKSYRSRIEANDGADVSGTEDIEL